MSKTKEMLIFLHNIKESRQDVIKLLGIIWWFITLSKIYLRI